MRRPTFRRARCLAASVSASCRRRSIASPTHWPRHVRPSRSFDGVTRNRPNARSASKAGATRTAEGSFLVLFIRNLRVPAERAERAKSRDLGAADCELREFALGPGSRFARPGHAKFLTQYDYLMHSYAALLTRLTSGGTASSVSIASALSSGITCWPSLPSRRIETVRSAASFLPTTSSTGTLASECSRTL